MENIKFTLFSILILTVMSGTGYWAFSTIESGSSHVDAQRQKELIQKNLNLEKQVADLTRQVSLLQTANDEQAMKNQAVLDTQVAAPNLNTVIPNPTKTVTPTTTKTVISKNQSLINDLQKLVNNKIYLKLKSQGSAVGILQKFLNLYNKTSIKVDSDFGNSTVVSITNFQKAQGLTADGATGPTTYLKMISWLKNH